MSAVNPDIQETIESVVYRMLRNFMGPFLAEVVAVTTDDLKRGLADIRSLQRPVKKDGHVVTYDDPVVMPGVPVLVPASTASDGLVKIAAGDLGLYVPLKYGLEGLLNATISGPVSPFDPNLYTGSGFFIPLVMNRSTVEAAASASRWIGGSDVRVGNAVSAEALAFKASVQSAIDDLASKINTVALAVPTSAPYAPAGPGPVPTIGGTSNLKAT